MPADLYHSPVPEPGPVAGAPSLSRAPAGQVKRGHKRATTIGWTVRPHIQVRTLALPDFSHFLRDLTMDDTEVTATLTTDGLLNELSAAAGRELTVEELVEIVKEKAQRGVNLSFTGKQQARRIARLVRPRVQRLNAGLSLGSAEQRAKNLIIEGDNLQALASLYKWRGGVDLILTDPPYNTGNDFRYNDRWDEDPNDAGLGNWVPTDDPARHTKWMKFMYPRLQMMHSMLKIDGILAICIDHRELFHLGQMLDEIFGESNRLAILNWQKAYSPKSGNDHVSTATEYVLVYARNEALASTRLLDRTDEMDARYQNKDGDTRAWTSGDLSAVGAASHQGMVFGIQSPITGEIHYPPSGRHWGTDRRTIKRWLEEWGTPYSEVNLHDEETRAKLCGLPQDEVRAGVRALVVKGPIDVAKKKAAEIYATGPWPAAYFLGDGGSGRPRLKRYLENVKKGFVPMTYWADDEHVFPEVLGSVSWDHAQSGHSQTGINELNAIMGRGHGFETVKPLRLMQKILQIWCPPDGVVLDPFAGSGTTGHAVLAMNSTTGSDRQFILIEQGRPERGDSYAKTLTAQRLKRAISGDWANGKGRPLDGGFAFKTLTKQVDANIVLQMERDEMVDTVIASHHDSNRRRGSSLVTFDELKYKYLVGKNSQGHGFYLVWEGPDGNIDLTEEVYEACVAEGRREKLEPIYHVYARYNLFGTEDVRFYRIPDQILIDFGLDMRTEGYSDGSA